MPRKSSITMTKTRTGTSIRASGAAAQAIFDALTAPKAAKSEDVVYRKPEDTPQIYEDQYGNERWSDSGEKTR